MTTGYPQLTTVFRRPFSTGLFLDGTFSKNRTNTVQFSELDRGKVTTVSHRSTRKIRCLRGVIWVTSSAKPGDHVLRAGDTLNIPGPGTTIAVSGQTGSAVRFSKE